MSIHMLLASAIIALASPDYPVDIQMNSTHGVAPFRANGTVIVDGTLSNVWIDVGGEDFYLASCELSPPAFNCRDEIWELAIDHEFSCPGSYELRVVRYGNPDVLASVTIAVAEPSVPVLAVVGQTAYDVAVATTPDIASRATELAVVDWGDGTSETFNWAVTDDVAMTPSHHYNADGEYTAKLTLYYAGAPCSYAQSATTLIKIPNPGTATRPTTWGAVKTLYR